MIDSDIIGTWVGEGGLQGTSPLDPGLTKEARVHYDALKAKIAGGMSLKEVLLEHTDEENARRLMQEGDALARIALRNEAIDRARARKSPEAGTVDSESTI